MHYPIIHEYLKHFLPIAINLKKETHKHLEREVNVSVATHWVVDNAAIVQGKQLEPYMHIIIWQGSLEVNPSILILIGSFLLGFLPYGPSLWKG